jgi:fructan beta-fructosidase
VRHLGAEAATGRPSASKAALLALGRSEDLTPEHGRIKLQVLVDRTSVEVFGNDGRLSMSSCFLPATENRSLSTFSVGGTARIVSLRVYRLKSAWDGQCCRQR